ncbi:MAG TPA: serine/threonine-protein kinase, partial [Polyangiaceae bacterium]|nr:serine/threonine-protein kinase [Polyangiaceae bacterium]
MSTKDDPLGLVGSTIGGKYLVERVIGEGGAAIVYKGTQQGWNVPVAIKLLVSLAMASERDRPALFEEFRREGKLISDLSTRSSAIVQPRDLGVLERAGEPPIPYLVLEWLDGKTLDEVIVGESQRDVAPRDLATTLKLLHGVARALSIAHDAGVVHRDVKPENLLVLDGSGQADVAVKLLDFGIAKVMQKRLDGVHQTGTMATAFTPHYGAPEQFSRTFGETGPWTDVFAMALVVIEVMRG